jgi:hypothetical protein
MVPSVILGRKQTLGTAGNKVAGDTDDVFRASVGDNPPFNKAKGRDGKGPAGRLDVAPSSAADGFANKVRVIEGHGEGAPGVKDDGEEVFKVRGGGTFGTSIRGQSSNEPGIDLVASL